MMRGLVRTSADVPGLPSLLAILERLSPGRRGRVGVLTYHRIDEPGARPWLSDGLISATPSAFAGQMEVLARDYTVISMKQLLGARRSGGDVPPSSVLLTFDDAYQDFAEHAWPVLRRLGLPVTLFVPTGYPGHPDRSFWWDRLYRAVMGSSRTGVVATAAGAVRLGSPDERRASYRDAVAVLKAMPHADMVVACDGVVGELDPERSPAPAATVLGWDELRRIESEGVSLAPHSRTHPRLDRLSEEMLADEIAGSRADLERAASAPLPVFAYPDGAHSEAVVAATAAAGYEMAFTTRRGGNRLGQTDWLRLRRINVGQQTNEAILRGELSLLTRFGAR